MKYEKQAGRICSVSWCGSEAKTRGLCGPCYSTWYQGRDPENRRRKVSKDATPEERLKFHGWTVTETGCWEWAGRVDKKGYGVLALREKRQAFAHRVAYSVWVGELDPDKAVCHTCDNPACINPEHLWLGTQKENIRDMTRKTRGNTTKLSRVQILEIFALRPEGRLPRGGFLVPTLSEKYGVSENAIRSIWNGSTWSTITKAGTSVE